MEGVERAGRHSMTELLDTLGRLGRYEEYLESVVHVSDYPEVADILASAKRMRGRGLHSSTFSAQRKHFCGIYLVNRPISVYHFPRRAPRLCTQLCMGIQPAPDSALTLCTQLRMGISPGDIPNRPIEKKIHQGQNN